MPNKIEWDPQHLSKKQPLVGGSMEFTIDMVKEVCLAILLDEFLTLICIDHVSM